MAVFNASLSAPSLGMMTQVQIIIPDVKAVYDMPVVYLLHGLSDNSTCWARLTSIERYAIESNCIVVMPEVQRSMYTDMKYGLKYFSYITKDLPDMMKRLFQINTNRENTFVAGLSMGGYGSLKTALSFPEKYAACASFSGVCDVFNFKERLVEEYGAHDEAIGIYGLDLEIGNENDLFYLADRADSAKNKPRIFMTCGQQDFLHEDNIKLKNKIESLSFDYKYEEWEGDHTWEFWDKSIKKAFDFFFNAK